MRDGTERPSPHGPAPLSPPNILVIEEVTTNRKIYAQIAASLGKQVCVHCFEKPTQALLWLKSDFAALVICDLWMSELDAFELLSFLRGNPRHNAVPVAVVMADAREGLKDRVLAAGASDVLIAPVPIFELRGRLERLLIIGD